MKEKIKIIIANDNTKLVSKLVSRINSKEDMEVVDTAKDGMEAIDKILKSKVDVVILDMFMPLLDGIGVLEEISTKMDVLPTFIILAPAINNIIVKLLAKSGVKIYLTKSLKTDVLIEEIRKSIEDKPEVHKLCNNVGIATHC